MLVLSRKKDQIIRLGDDIKVMVVDIRDDNRVRLGITAPDGLQIWRQELWEEKEAGRTVHMGLIGEKMSRLKFSQDSMNRARQELFDERKITRSPAYLAAIKTALTVADASIAYADEAAKADLRMQAASLRDFLAMVASTDAVSELKGQVA